MPPSAHRSSAGRGRCLRVAIAPTTRPPGVRTAGERCRKRPLDGARHSIAGQATPPSVLSKGSARYAVAGECQGCATCVPVVVGRRPHLAGLRRDQGTRTGKVRGVGPRPTPNHCQPVVMRTRSASAAVPVVGGSDRRRETTGGSGRGADGGRLVTGRCVGWWLALSPWPHAFPGRSRRSLDRPAPRCLAGAASGEPMTRRGDLAVVVGGDAARDDRVGSPMTATSRTFGKAPTPLPRAPWERPKNRSLAALSGTSRVVRSRRIICRPESFCQPGPARTRSTVFGIECRRPVPAGAAGARALPVRRGVPEDVARAVA